MKESVKQFCSLNGLGEVTAEMLYDAYIGSEANDDSRDKKPGAKCKLQFPRELREQFERDCGFTDEELEIFRMRAQGMSIIQISFALGRTEYYSTEKVERRIRSIKDKIAAAIEG